MTDTRTQTCHLCGDPLTAHIGEKPCTGGHETYAEKRARLVREQDRKRVLRLFGQDAI